MLKIHWNFILPIIGINMTDKTEALYREFIKKLKFECEIFDLDFEEEQAQVMIKYSRK